MNNNPKYLTAKTIINNIEKKWDKNNNRYYKVWVKWNEQSRCFLAFASDYSLQISTLQMLTERPHQLINQQVLITYEEIENRQQLGTIFTRLKEIQLT